MGRTLDGISRLQLGEAVLGRVVGVAHDDDVFEIVETVTDGGQLSQVIALIDPGDDDEGAGPALTQNEPDLFGP